ncbi:isovaleryl-CoA dehydrogenase [Phenylobacterium sp. LjRoot225]|uniref:isovaleryl-CoA dehydrogenase n=1 Tax=Phenylobacterium sp. LjRoot225 TaxID=3342285 RepID=UPI003ECC5106
MGGFCGSPDGQTHEVLNQPTPLADLDLFTSDRVLAEASAREGAAWAAARLRALGRRLGSAEMIEAGFLANRNPPILRSFDRFGRRRDEVEFHPAWHALMELAVAEGLHTGPWSDPQPGAHVARAAAFYMLGQVEAGVQCPMAMTYGAAPVIRREPDIAAEWLPRLYSRRYDPRFAPAAGKAGALMGMGMTEKQGGSDVRANTTRAEPIVGEDRVFRLVGHKWFFSAPMCDAFLVLAQAPAGLSCFFLPRWTPDGELNALRLQRLKDKLGDRANASSEVEFEGAWAWLIGEEGRGVPAILEMATYTRLDCVVASAGLMRQAVAQATHHAAQRTTFQRRLTDHPLMTNVLADLALESEAATVLALRLARAFDRLDEPHEAALRRLLTPAAKYWVCKRTSAVTAEALEVIGGNGFVEESVMPRLYRQAPLNSIWEGSGNLMALDALRALSRSPEAGEAVAAELEPARGADARLDRYIAGALDALARTPDEADARRLCERLVLAVQGALLVRFSPGEVADGFCASRMDEGSGGAFGTLPQGLNLKPIVERAMPL